MYDFIAYVVGLVMGQARLEHGWDAEVYVERISPSRQRLTCCTGRIVRQIGCWEPNLEGGTEFIRDELPQAKDIRGIFAKNKINLHEWVEYIRE